MIAAERDDLKYVSARHFPATVSSAEDWYYGRQLGKWLEVGAVAWVDPNVLQKWILTLNVIQARDYIGLDRFAMLRYGVKWLRCFDNDFEFFKAIQHYC